VRVRDGRQIGFVVDAQIPRAETLSGDRVGAVGKTECEVQVGGVHDFRAYRSCRAGTGLIIGLVHSGRIRTDVTPLAGADVASGFTMANGDSHYTVTPGRFTLTGPSGATIYDAPVTTWWSAG